MCLGVDEPVIGPEVDDPRPVREFGREARGRAVRQGEEHEIGRRERVRPGLRESQVGDRGQVRVHVSHALPGVAVRGDDGELEVRMTGDEAQHLATGVATGAGDGDPMSHAQNYA
ncbi:hypothetical protein GCM10027265_16310 [Jatrophihabitans fulvus]